MKKFLSVILAVAIIICAVPIGLFTVAAENGVLDGYYYYKVENDEATILSVNPAISGAITVPSSLGGYPVTIIGEDAFRGCEGITAVTIPDSVTSIGVDAFYGCSNLSNITTQDNITSIGRWAFHSTAFYYNSDNWENDVLYIGNYLIDSKSDISGDYTIKEGTILIADDAFDFSHNLINVTIPDSVKYIGEGVFSNCSKLASVEIPNGVKTIERYTFSSCIGLKSVTIGSGVENIDFNAFGNCGSLSSIVVKPDNKYFASDETGVLFNKDKTKLIRYPNGKPDTEYAIPDGVVYICENAFWACDDLINVTISDGVKEIGVRAFEKCTDMESVVISDSVTRIGTAAFSGCYNLECITIGDGVTSIGEKAFDLTQFKNEESNWQGNSLYINNYLVDANISGDFIIKDETKVIADHIFDNRSYLTSVTIPDSVINIGNSTFYNCNELVRIDVSEQNEYYASQDGILFDKDITKLIKYPVRKTDSTYIVPDGVTTICEAAFRGCNDIVAIVFPETLTTIGDEALQGCFYLDYAFIPKSVTFIGEDAFPYNCVTVFGYVGSYAESYAKKINGDFFAIFDSKDENGNNICYNISVDRTSSYTAYILYDENVDNGSNATFAVYDKNGNHVYYSFTKDGYAGYPLVAGEKYTVVASENIFAFNFTIIYNELFEDTNESAWYYDAVTYAVGSGIMSGYQNGLFGTSDSIQRQDFLVMLARLDGVDLSDYEYDSTFPDVGRNSYYEAAVNWGAKNGIVTGYDSGKFGVGDKVTREHLVTFLYRYAKYKGYDYSYTTDRETTVSGQYKDFKNVSGFAKDSILWAIEKGVISGKTSSTIVPQGNAQRCEVAQIMYNIYQKNIF